MSFLFNSYLFYIVNSPCNIPKAEACYYINGSQERLEIKYEKRNDLFITHHEIGHLKLNKIIEKNLDFWNKFEIVKYLPKGQYDFNVFDKDPKEKVANLYACYQMGIIAELPEEIINKLK